MSTLRAEGGYSGRATVAATRKELTEAQYARIAQVFPVQRSNVSLFNL